MDSINRRQFLARSALATSVLGPSFSLFGETGAQLRVAVIGHTGRGNYGHGLDVMWKGIPEASVVAVADLVAEGLSSACERLPGAEGFGDYRLMLQDVRPDIVAIAPRHVDQHLEMVLAAVNAGVRGIYIEKPFCRSPKEADKILAACSDKNVKIAVAHRNRYHPVLPLIKELIASEEFGKLLEIRGRGKEDARGGAQDVWVLGSHVFNLAEYFAGKPVAAFGMLYQDGRPCTAADIREGGEGIGAIAGNELHARFEMANGRAFFFDSIQNQGDGSANFGLQLICTKGVVDFRVDREPLAHVRKGNPHNPGDKGGQWLNVSSAGIGRPEPNPDLARSIASHQAAGKDLIDAILQDRAPVCDGDQGLVTVEMICGIFASHLKGGGRVAFPLAERANPLSLV
jgi:predicted dehydrogenase